MPVNSHPISVTILDTDSTAFENATFQVRNTTKGVTSDSETTNASGNAEIDLANLDVASGQTNPYDNGDTITLMASNSDSSKTATATYTVTGSSYTTTMTLSLTDAVDPLTAIKTLLDDNWNSLATDDITPTVSLIVNKKQISLANGDHILLYSVDEPIDAFGIGAQEWANKKIVSIDIRTTYKRAVITDIRAHLIKMKGEVVRIIKAKTANPDSNHQLLLPKRVKDLSDKRIGLGRYVMDVELSYWG